MIGTEISVGLQIRGKDLPADVLCTCFNRNPDVLRGAKRKQIFDHNAAGISYCCFSFDEYRGPTMKSLWDFVGDFADVLRDVNKIPNVESLCIHLGIYCDVLKVEFNLDFISTLSAMNMSLWLDLYFPDFFHISAVPDNIQNLASGETQWFGGLADHLSVLCTNSELPETDADVRRLFWAKDCCLDENVADSPAIDDELQTLLLEICGTGEFENSNKIAVCMATCLRSNRSIEISHETFSFLSEHGIRLGVLAAHRTWIEEGRGGD